MSGIIRRTVQPGRVVAAALAGLLATLAIAPAAHATNRALLIGVGDYLNDREVPDLAGAVNDVKLMRQVLISRFGYAEEDITVLTDADATRAGILAAIATLVSQTQPGDRVYLHYSGHGSQVKDLDGDEEDGLDETIMPHDARTPDVPDITDDELNLLLAPLDAGAALVVLDSCHSGTATRAATVMRTRSVPMDTRSAIYSAAGPAVAAMADPGRLNAPQRYVLMTGAASHQSALDGPLEEGTHYGLFTWALVQSLRKLPVGSSAEAVHAAAHEEMRGIGNKYGLIMVPTPQLEGEPALLAEPLLGESGRAVAADDARLAWVQAVRESPTTWRLEGAALAGAEPGSLWGIYAEDETAFEPGSAKVVIRILETDGDDAIGEAFGQRAAEAGPAPPAAAMATRGGRSAKVAPAPPPGSAAIHLDQMNDERRTQLATALGRSQRLKLVGPGEFARFVVDWEGNRVVVRGAGGIQVVGELVTQSVREAALYVGRIAGRSLVVDDLLALDNPTSTMDVKVRVRPMEPSGTVRGIKLVGAGEAPAYQVRRSGEPRTSYNSLQLEIEVSEDAYITVVDIDPEGSVTILFPNPFSERTGFYPGGRIAGGQTVLIPDALEDSRAGFYWDYSPPTGTDTVRVFAANDRQLAARIRAYLAQMASSFGRRDAGRPSGAETLYLPDPDADTGRAPDWAAGTVTFVVED